MHGRTEDAVQETGRARDREGRIQYRDEEGRENHYRLRYGCREAGEGSVFDQTVYKSLFEKMFGTYKTVLNADKLYLQDNESVFGDVFIAFLSLSLSTVSWSSS